MANLLNSQKNSSSTFTNQSPRSIISDAPVSATNGVVIKSMSKTERHILLQLYQANIMIPRIINFNQLYNRLNGEINISMNYIKGQTFTFDQIDYTNGHPLQVKFESMQSNEKFLFIQCLEKFKDSQITISDFQFIVEDNTGMIFVIDPTRRQDSLPLSERYNTIKTLLNLD